MRKHFNIKEYRLRVKESDFFYNRFNQLASKTEEFLLNHTLTNKKTCDSVAKNLWSTFTACDEIDYESYDLAIAYTIVHFLDRYHRFQINFSKLLDHKFLPLSYKNIDILDVGTGPAPALFAVSDIYNSIKIFGEITGKMPLTKIIFKCDYVEKSHGFRKWLHNFLEFVYDPTLEIRWEVPFHHGTFSDFTNIEFNRTTGYGKDAFQFKFRYNIILLGNFLTQENHLRMWENQILNCAKYLRNNGKLIVIGGTGDKYINIYEQLDSIITKTDYSDHLNTGRCKKLKIRKKHLVFDMKDRFGKRLKEFYKIIHERFEEYNSINEMNPEAKQRFEAYVSTSTGRIKKWEMNAYNKFARHKWYLTKRRKKTWSNI